MIEYRTTLNSNNEPKHVRVLIDGRIAGTIWKATDKTGKPGWQYRTNSGLKSEIFPTLAEIKKSLEEE